MTGAVMVLVVAFLVIGCLVFVTGFLGCFGAWKLSKCFLRLFATILVLIIIAEIVCGVILVVNKDRFKPCIKDFFTDAIEEIESNPNSALTAPIRKLQDSFDCCGANGPSDWAKPMDYCCGDKKVCATFLPPGCVNKISHKLRKHSVGVGACVVVLAVIEIGTIVAAPILAKRSE